MRHRWAHAEDALQSGPLDVERCVRCGLLRWRGPCVGRTPTRRYGALEQWEASTDPYADVGRRPAGPCPGTAEPARAAS